MAHKIILMVLFKLLIYLSSIYLSIYLSTYIYVVFANNYKVFWKMYCFVQNWIVALTHFTIKWMLTIWSVCVRTCTSSYQGHYIIISHISLGSTRLWKFLRLALFLKTLTVLKSSIHYCVIFYNFVLCDVFLMSRLSCRILTLYFVL